MRLVHGDHAFAQEVRRHLHRLPELSLQEYKTACYIKEQLEGFGVQYETIHETGIFGCIEGNASPTENNPGHGKVLLRADIDALPIVEETTLAFKSENHGVMHACGHDIHASALLTALKWLAANKDSFCGKVYFVFQPGEEFGHGAQFFTQAGLNIGYDRVFGLHIAPNVPVGSILISGREDAASCDYFRISLEGVSAHATTPHLGRNALLAISELAVQIHGMSAEFLSPLEKVSVSIGRIKSGEAFNIIPDYAEMEGSIRAFSDDVREKLKYKLHDLIRATELRHGVKAKLEISCFAKPLLNDSEAVEDFKELMRCFSKEVQLLMTDKPAFGFAADDFSEFTAVNPGLYVHVGTGNEQYPPSMEGLHSARLEPDERAIPLAADLYLNYALYVLEKNKR